MQPQRPSKALALVSGRLPGLLFLVAALGLLGALAGCGGPAEVSVTLPEMRLITPEPVLCVPGRRWEPHPDGDRWLFRNVTSVYCTVAPGAEGPLVITLEPDEQTSRFTYAVTWDQQPLFEGRAVSLPEVGGEIAVPRELVTPGRHELRLRRAYLRGEGKLPHWQENHFVATGYRTTAGPVPFRLEREEAYEYLGDFVELGLAGLGKEKRGGLLFAGPGEAPFRVTTDGAGRLRLTLENASAEPATFTLASGGEVEESAVVPPRGQGELETAVEPGETAFTLAVEGAAEGLFLAGYPYLDTGADGWPRERPPVVLVTLDTTRRDALAPYGGRADVTPELAAFAAGATVFERAYSTTSWTLPSHASMMTGLWPSRHDAAITRMSVSWRATAAAELLERAGYASAGFAGGEVCSNRFGVSKGFHLWRDPDQFETKGDRLTGYVQEYLEGHTSRPLFLFVNYFDPHAAYQAPEEYQRLLDVPRHREALAEAPLWQRFDRGDIAAWGAIIDGKAKVTPEILAYARAAYLAEVSFMDHQVGRLFAALKQHGMWDDALVIVVADHGEMLGEEDYFGHAGRLDPELTEVPLIIKFPHQRRGGRVSELVSVIDLFPTLLAAAGITPPVSDGLPLGPEGIAVPNPDRSSVLMEEHDTLFHPLRASMRIAPNLYGIQRLASRRVVWPEGQTCERRRGDGWEPTKCPDEGPELYERMRRLLGTGELLRGDAGKSLSAEDQKALEALGYL